MTRQYLQNHTQYIVVHVRYEHKQAILSPFVHVKKAHALSDTTYMTYMYYAVGTYIQPRMRDGRNSRSYLSVLVLPILCSCHIKAKKKKKEKRKKKDKWNVPFADLLALSTMFDDDWTRLQSRVGESGDVTAMPLQAGVAGDAASVESCEHGSVVKSVVKSMTCGSHPEMAFLAASSSLMVNSWLVSVLNTHCPETPNRSSYFIFFCSVLVSSGDLVSVLFLDKFCMNKLYN